MKLSDARGPKANRCSCPAASRRARAKESWNSSEPGPACVPLPRTGWGQDAAGTFVPPSGTDASLRLPDLILVPAVGISPAGARLGYGKGFYDRLLALPGWGGAKRLALVHSLQLAAFPAGPLDIPMHGYATEKELIWL